MVYLTFFRSQISDLDNIGSDALITISRDSEMKLLDLLQKFDAKSFCNYKQLSGKTFDLNNFQLRFVHIQGSPGAFPASVCHLLIKIEELGLASNCFTSKPRVLATADFVLRAFQKAVIDNTQPNRGVQGSGSFQPLSLPPQVLQRNVVTFTEEEVQIAFHVSLPGSPTNTVLGSQANEMFTEELPAIVNALKKATSNTFKLTQHCDVVEDMLIVQSQVEQEGLVAFISDGSILARASGVSQAPLDENPVVFHTPDELAIELDFPNSGRVRGLGLRKGVNAIIGAGFHGKSTFLNALAKGVYPHIPGDGREKVITNPDAIVVSSEDGRSIRGLDISGFITNLPNGVDEDKFSTENASGSTSEAAAIVESMLAGAKLLLIDEDSSALNFLIKDPQMRELLPEETITPLFDRIREMYQTHDVSTLITIGGCSDYLGVADQVIAIQKYLPISISDKIDNLKLPQPSQPNSPLILNDNRRLLTDNFDPSYCASRFDNSIDVRIKPLRLQEKILEYGDEKVDLTHLIALVDPCQTLALGYALLLARQAVRNSVMSPSQLAYEIFKRIENEGLALLSQLSEIPLFLAQPRKLELAAAINRIRRLKVAFG